MSRKISGSRKRQNGYWTSAGCLIAEEANTEAAAIRAHLRAIEATRKEIQEITALSVSTSEGLRSMLLKCRTFTTDYAELPPETKQRLGAMVNHTKAGAQLLNRVVGAKA